MTGSKQRGTVIIIVLWTAVLLTVLVTAMASKVRLSAKTAMNNQEASLNLPELMSAVSQAEMELMLERMPRPLGETLAEDEDGEILEPKYRFDGEPLELSYPLAEDVVVRIYDHGGKINLNRIPRRNMQLLIEKRLGGEEADPQQVQDLLSAWTDWTDLNDLEGINGAEKDYYQDLELPYSPRNNPELDTVEELLQVRGFAELFEGVNLDAAFTIYGTQRNVNLNLATREAMELLPGLDDELIENILAFRGIKDLNTREDLAQIVPLENLLQLSGWVGNETSNVYSVFVYPRLELEQEPYETLLQSDPFLNRDLVTQAYMEIIEVRNYTSLPVIYKIDPYGQLPDTGPPRVAVEDYLFD